MKPRYIAISDLPTIKEFHIVSFDTLLQAVVSLAKEVEHYPPRGVIAITDDGVTFAPTSVEYLRSVAGMDLGLAKNDVPQVECAALG